MQQGTGQGIILNGMRRCGLGSVLVAGVALVAAAACGLDTSGSGLFPDDGGSSGDGGASGGGSGSASGGSSGSGSGGSSGAASGSSSGSGSGSSSGSSSGSDGGGDGNTGPCQSGWTLVLGVSGGGGCPSGYPEAYMGLTNPQAQAGACTCSCSITQQPSCTTGTVNWGYGMQAPLCLTPSPVNSNGKCQPSNATLASAQFVAPLAPTGGACTGQAVGDPSKVQTTQVRACSVPASDEASVCAGGAPGGSAACILAQGDVPCPQGSPFQIRSVIGDTETLVCSACGSCGVSATCTGAELDIYSDMGCANMMTSITANSTCVNVQGGPMKAFWYKAQVTSPACKATGTAASFQTTNAQTLCCR